MERVPLGYRKLNVISVNKGVSETEINTEEVSDTSLEVATFSFFCSEEYISRHHLSGVRAGDVIFAQLKNESQSVRFASDISHLVYVPLRVE